MAAILNNVFQWLISSVPTPNSAGVELKVMHDFESDSRDNELTFTF